MTPVQKLLGWLLMAICMAAGGVKKAHAAFPATPTNPGACTVAPCTEYGVQGASSLPWFSTKLAACEARVAQLNTAVPSEAPHYVVDANYGTGGAQCRYMNKFGTYYAVPYTTRTVPPVTAEYTCPANSTLSGSSCTCNAPLVQNSANTGCEAPPDPQEELCNALSGTETYASGPGNIAPGASSCNASGCMTTFANTLIRVKNPQGQMVTEGAATFTGGTCVYSETTGTAEDTCPGGTEGTVNGVTTCVPYDPKLNTIETVSESESTEQEGSDTTNTSTTSTTTCSNGSCTTTTNTTTNINGTPSTKTTQTTEPQTDYCAKNPTASQCKEGGQFGGTCGSFTCSGDAVQCAQALASQKLYCAATELPAEIGAAAGKVLDDKIPEGFFIDGPSISPPSSVTGACVLTDLQITWIYESTLSVKLSTFCQYMDTIRALLGVFGALAYALIVFKG